MPYIGSGVSRFNTADSLTVSGTTTLTGNATAAGTLDVTGAITSSAGATITTDDNSANLTLKSTDADGGRGPDLVLTRDSASPADGDAIGFISWTADNDAGADHAFCGIEVLASDVSDGSEDATWSLMTQVAGTSRSRFSATPTETVLNEDSIDSDFRVESNGSTHALFVEGSSGNVGIGCTNGDITSDGNANRTYVTIQGTANRGRLNLGCTASNGADTATLGFTNGANTVASISCDSDSGSQTAGNIGFATAGSVRATIDSSGNVLVGASSNDTANVGHGILANGFAYHTRDGEKSLILNRKSNDGVVLELRKNDTSFAAFKVTDGDNLTIDCTSSNHAGFTLAADSILPRRNGSGSDNAIDLGSSGDRFDDVFATNGTIQTSDQNEKQNIASLTTAEITAAKALSKLFKTFKWKDKVAAKGDAARTHSGVIAQEVQTAMSDAGLDASKYAFWCSDTWWETSTEVEAVEADEEAGIEAQDAYTRIDTYDTADDAPDGATQRTRMGIRYPELLAFIGAATEQRLADIETRLTALENA